MSEGELAVIRSGEIGFVFQNSQLLPRLTAPEECGAAADLCGCFAKGAPHPRPKNAGTRGA